MRLKVTHGSDVSGSGRVWYKASPATKVSNDDVTRRHLESLARKIELIGKNLLGDDLNAVSTNMFPGAIGLSVTKGISSGPKRFDFRSFIGWVEIFGTETGLATRASLPRVN
jgi:hypothetical protein